MVNVALLQPMFYITLFEIFLIEEEEILKNTVRSAEIFR